METGHLSLSRELERGVGPASRITLAPDKQPKPLGDASRGCRPEEAFFHGNRTFPPSSGTASIWGSGTADSGQVGCHYLYSRTRKLSEPPVLTDSLQSLLLAVHSSRAKYLSVGLRSNQAEWTLPRGTVSGGTALEVSVSHPLPWEMIDSLGFGLSCLLVQGWQHRLSKE